MPLVAFREIDKPLISLGLYCWRCRVRGGGVRKVLQRRLLSPGEVYAGRGACTVSFEQPNS